MNLNNLKIGQRLMLGFGAVIALIVVLVFVGWTGFSKVQTRYWKTNMLTSIESEFMNARLNSRLFIQKEDLQYADKLNSAMDNMQSSINKLIPTLNTKSNQEQLARINAEAKSYKEAAGQYVEATKIKQEALKSFDEVAKSIMEEIKVSRLNQKTVISFMSARIYGQKYLRLGNENDYQSWEKSVEDCEVDFTGSLASNLGDYKNAFHLVYNQIKIQRDEESQFKDAGDALNKEVDASVTSMSEQMVNEINNALFTMVVIGVIAVFLGLIFAQIINRSIRIGINQGVIIATTIADGDLTLDMDKALLVRKDEIGDLSRALDKMVEKLKEFVESIVIGSNNLASASEQTSSTAQQLSQGANEQASSVEEVSSTMEEMTSNIQQNSDNAQQTEKIASFSSEGIKNVASASQESLKSIRNISDKIGIINDIAFQTNILALNAAVEAARAGEHGRGFAVVAAEVRKLAERSKIAANEIVDLAKSSVQVTEEAGKMMMTILPEIDKTAKLVQEIAAASVEQNNGSLQINNAIQQLNSVTQQNASASEEMASNAEELTSQAEQFREIVSYFKLNTNHSKTITQKSRKEVSTNTESKHKLSSNKSSKGVNLKMSSKDEENYTNF